MEVAAGGEGAPSSSGDDGGRTGGGGGGQQGQVGWDFCLFTVAPSQLASPV